MSAKKKIPVRHTKPPKRGQPAEWVEEESAADPPVTVHVKPEEPEAPQIPPMQGTPIPAEPTIADLLRKQEAEEIAELVKRLQEGKTLTAAQRKKVAAWEKAEARATFVSGFDPVDIPKIAEDLKAWWVNGEGGNFYVNEGGNWLRIQREMLLLRMNKMGVRGFRFPGESSSPQEDVLLHIERKRVLHRCLEGLAGYKSGVHLLKNRNILLMNGANLLKPQAGDWSLIGALVDGILSYDEGTLNRMEQCYYFHAWMQRAVENLYLAGDVVLNGQLLALAGEQGSGKSRLQHFLITPLLGNRAADPQPYLFGDTDFNDEWMEAEHLCTEDPRPSAKLHDRVQFAQKLKGLVVNDNHRWRGLYRGAMTVSPKFRVTMSFNADPDAVRFFPPLTPDFRDKVIILRAQKRALPMPTGTPDERRLFREKITEQLPAYLHYLLSELQVPSCMKNERFGVREFADVEIRSLLWDDSPAAEFLEIIDEAELTVDRGAGHGERRSIFYSAGGMTAEEAVAEYSFKIAGTPARALVNAAAQTGRRLWIGWFGELQARLEDDTCSRKAIARKLIHHNSVPRMLGRLSNDCPDRVALHATKKGRLWVILEREPVTPAPEF